MRMRISKEGGDGSFSTPTVSKCSIKINILRVGLSTEYSFHVVSIASMDRALEKVNWNVFCFDHVVRQLERDCTATIKVVTSFGPFLYQKSCCPWILFCLSSGFC